MSALELQRPAWEAIRSRIPRPNPYLHLDWLAPWWKHCGQGTVHVVRVDAPNTGRAIGFAPFFVRPRSFRHPFRTLSFLGSKRTDYLDCLVDPANAISFFRELAQHILTVPVSMLQLHDLPHESPTPRMLGDALGALGVPCEVVPGNPCVGVPLPRSFDEWLARLSPRTRRDIAYDRRYIEKHFDVEVAEFARPEEMDRALEALRTVYEQRWPDSASSLASDRQWNFASSVARSAANRGAYRVWVLYGDGAPAAALSGCFEGGILYADVFAHAPRFHGWSVGSVLLGRIIEQGIAEGWNEMDLSRGDEAYKFRFGGVAKRNFVLRAYPRGRLQAKIISGVHRLAESPLLDRVIRTTRARTPAQCR